MLYLHGIGHFFPENVISNDFLEDLDIGTSNSWIVERVGIRNRRTVLPLDYIRETRNQDPQAAQEAAVYTNAETGVRAARMALQRAGLTARDIGVVIAGGCCADYAIPAEACIIAHELAISVPAVDINSACSTFGAHLHFLSLMDPDRVPDFVLIVHPENTTRTVNYADRSVAVLWGDGTSAAVVSTRVPARVRVDLTGFGSDPAGWAKVTIPRMGHFAQQGRAVQTFAIRRCRQLVKQVAQQADIPLSEVKFIGHQANLLMLEAVCRYCEITPENHFFNVTDYGNTGAAGAPSVFSQHWDSWTDGTQLVMAVVGSGLSWSALRITVGDTQ